MKKTSLTTKTDAELATLLSETRKTLREERYAAAGARAKDPNQARALRKQIARALTEAGRRRSESASRPEASGHTA